MRFAGAGAAGARPREACLAYGSAADVRVGERGTSHRQLAASARSWLWPVDACRKLDGTKV